MTTSIDVIKYLSDSQRAELRAIIGDGQQGNACILLDTFGESSAGSGLDTHGEFIVTTLGVARAWERAEQCQIVAKGCTLTEIRESARAWHEAEIALGTEKAPD